MNQKMWLKNIIVVSATSFVLHFIWEWFQCGPFFIHRGVPASPVSMAMSAIGDVLLTFLIIGLALLIGGSDPSLKKLTKTHGIFFIEIFAVIIAIAVEKYALATNRWSYTEINPVIPILRVSLLPILQMMILTPTIACVASRIVRRST